MAPYLSQMDWAALLTFFTPPLLNRIHGGSHSPGNSPLSDANRGHGHDSARIELHESTGKHVSYGNGSWLQCLYHGAHSSGILVSLGTAQVQPVFCSFQKLSKCNKHQPCQKGLVSASCLRTADWATFSVYAPPWKSARWLQRAKGGRGRDRKTMRQIYSGWGVGGRRRERTRAVKRLQPLLVLVPVWMAELCTHSGFPLSSSPPLCLLRAAILFLSAGIPRLSGYFPSRPLCMCMHPCSPVVSI